jgi:GxxExxY protein
MGLVHGEVTGRILGAAFEVHRVLGPGLLENAYRVCLARELAGQGLRLRQEVPVPIHFKGVDLECGYRCDLVIDDAVIVELKAIDRLLPIHDSQLLTYLKLSRLRVGLLINFNASPLRTGIRRLVL